jgi:hypothetical protein
MTRPQHYPRVEDTDDKYEGFLDESQLVQHSIKVDIETFRKIISSSIVYASKKSSRAILDIPDDLSENLVNDILLKQGYELFKYFVKYCGDPASSAFDCVGKHYTEIAREQFHNRTLQKERMNSGWRYQFIARDMAQESRRFLSVSDIGAAEADFNAVIKQLDDSKSSVSIYVSIKNRVNTMGGQDWPKAIRALESVANTDKNRTGPYICVFGIAMEHGTRTIKNEQKTKQPYSVNTEVWLSDFFWPFFSNYSYLEVINEVISTLESLGAKDKDKVKTDSTNIPDQLLESFGDACRQFKLLDENDKFYDAHRLAELFVMGIKDFRSLYAI